MIAADHALFLAINGLQGNPIVDFFFLWVTELGALYVAIPAGVLLTILTRARGGWNLAWRATAVGLVIGGAGASLKLVFMRPRPLATLEGVRVLGSELYRLSFPSGHTITAFVVAGLLWSLNRRVGAAWFVVACLVGFSRIYVGAHFPSDVLAGAVLGFVPSLLIGRRVLKEYRDAA